MQSEETHRAAVVQPLLVVQAALLLQLERPGFAVFGLLERPASAAGCSLMGTWSITGGGGRLHGSSSCATAAAAPVLSPDRRSQAHTLLHHDKLLLYSSHDIFSMSPHLLPHRNILTSPKPHRSPHAKKPGSLRESINIASPFPSHLRPGAHADIVLNNRQCGSTCSSSNTSTLPKHQNRKPSSQTTQSQILAPVTAICSEIHRIVRPKHLSWNQPNITT